MALTADQLNTIYQNVLFRNVDTAGIQFFANRTDISDAQVRQQIELSQEASTFVSPIVRLYQEVLGRVPDAAGLRFFSNQLRAGTSLDNVAQQLVSSAEFSAKSTAVSGAIDATDLTNTNQLVSDAFQSILGRTPAAGEFAFFQGRTPAQILSLVAGSPEAASTNAAGVVTFLDSVAQGSYPTGTLNNQTGPGGTPVGTTTALTTAIDTLTGTGSNDTFIGTFAGGATDTLNLGDTVDGSTGTDTLRIISATGTATPAATVRGIEAFQLQTTVAQTTGNGFDFTNVTAATGGSAITNSSAVASIVSNVNFVPTSYTIQGGGAAHTLNFTAAAVAGAADTLNVTVTGGTGTATSLTVTNGSAGTGGIETVALTSSGGTKNNIQITDTSTGFKTLSVAGDTSAVVTGIDFGAASTSTTGTVTVTNTAGANITFSGADDLTITGGAGADRFNLSSSLTSADNINGGGGSNTLAATAAEFTTGLTVTNIKTLEVTDQVSSGTLTVSNINGATDAYLSFGAGTTSSGGIANTGSFTVAGLASGATVTIETDGDADPTAFTAALTTPGGTSDVLNLKLNANDTSSSTVFSTVTTTGFESVFLNSTKGTGVLDTAGAHTISSLVDAQLQTLTITGDTSVTISASTTANLTTISAGTATGNINLGAITHAADAASFTTGSGNDTITFNVLTDAILRLDAGGQTGTNGGDTLSLTGAAAGGVTKIDLSSTTDQVTQVNGGTNGAVTQVGFENVTSALTTNGMEVIGSAGKNVISGSAVADIIQGGAGADTIDVGASGTGAVDTVRYNVADVASGTLLVNADTVANFTSGGGNADLIDVAGFSLKAANGATVTTAFSTTVDDVTVASVALGSAASTDATALYTLTSSNQTAFTSQAAIDAAVAQIGTTASTSVFTATAGVKAFISVVGSDTTDVALFSYEEAGTNGIQATELKLVGVFTTADQLSAANLT